MYDLTKLSLQDVTDIGSALRQMGKGADSLESVAERCVQYFNENMRNTVTGEPDCALIRFFKTHAYGDLPTALQAQASAIHAQDSPLPAEAKCLTLLSTAGIRADWCDRHTSQGHQAIPLTSEKTVSQIPMIAQLIKSFGLDISHVLDPNPDLLMDLEQKTCNVFYIPTAVGSEFIPAQAEFVQPFGVQSVLGFGGMLPSGNLFAIILFSKVVIPEASARLFKTLPLSIKMAMIPFDKAALFNAVQAI